MIIHPPFNVRCRVIPAINLFLNRIFPACRFALVFAFVCAGFIGHARAVETPTFRLDAKAQVDSRGVFLDQIVKSDQPLPQVRLCDAPAFGKDLKLTLTQVTNLLAAAAPEIGPTNWTGAAAVEISRRVRTLNEKDALALLTSTLQTNYVQDEGKLELTFTSPWNPPVVPDEPLTVKILELPTVGVTPYFIIRFQLCTATETVGTWQASLQAHVWRDVWVAHSDLQRGTLISDADVVRDRRDVLNVHDELADFSADDSNLQLSQSVPADSILLARDLQPRTVIHRGQMANALLQDGALSITMKVEVMQDGARGQIVRIRNPVSKRDLSGKVLDDQTILVSL